MNAFMGNSLGWYGSSPMPTKTGIPKLLIRGQCTGFHLRSVRGALVDSPDRMREHSDTLPRSGVEYNSGVREPLNSVLNRLFGVHFGNDLTPLVCLNHKSVPWPRKHKFYVPCAL